MAELAVITPTPQENARTVAILKAAAQSKVMTFCQGNPELLLNFGTRGWFDMDFGESGSVVC